MTPELFVDTTRTLVTQAYDEALQIADNHRAFAQQHAEANTLNLKLYFEGQDVAGKNIAHEIRALRDSLNDSKGQNDVQQG